MRQSFWHRNGPMMILIAVVVIGTATMAQVVLRGSSASGQPSAPATQPESQRAMLPRTALASAAPVMVASKPFPMRDYNSLMTRSIFARDGRSRGGAGSSDERPSRSSDPPRRYAPTYAVRGVMREGSRLVAFIEDVGAGRIMTLSPGDSVGDGKIADIGIDHVTYKVGATTRQVQVGQMLDGSTAAPPRSSSPPTTAPSTGSSSTPPSSTTPSASPSDSGGGNLSLEERMRQRRQQGG